MTRAALSISGDSILESISISCVDGLIDGVVEVAVQVRSETPGRIDMVHVGVIEAGGTLCDALIAGRRARSRRSRRRAQQERNERRELQHDAGQ